MNEYAITQSLPLVDGSLDRTPDWTRNYRHQGVPKHPQGRLFRPSTGPRSTPRTSLSGFHCRRRGAHAGLDLSVDVETVPKPTTCRSSVDDTRQPRSGQRSRARLNHPRRESYRPQVSWTPVPVSVGSASEGRLGDHQRRRKGVDLHDFLTVGGRPKFYKS